MSGETLAGLIFLAGLLIGFGMFLFAPYRDIRCPDGSPHTFDYDRRTIGGWGVVRCTTCTYTDLY